MPASTIDCSIDSLRYFRAYQKLIVANKAFPPRSRERRQAQVVFHQETAKANIAIDMAQLEAIGQHYAANMPDYNLFLAARSLTLPTKKKPHEGWNATFGYFGYHCGK